MSRPIDRLAMRVLDDPRFLGAALAAYARDEGLDDAGLAAWLGCSLDGLTRLRLCYRPREDRLHDDLRLLSQRFGARALALLQALRRADALTALRAAPGESTAALLAARDHEEGEDKQ